MFGSARDHYGVRDLWESLCQENSIKSVIGNFRDNRFRALFQTSTEVFLHQNHFIEVLEMGPDTNLRVKAVKANLMSEYIATILQCFWLIHLKITGP